MDEAARYFIEGGRFDPRVRHRAALAEIERISALPLIANLCLTMQCVFGGHSTWAEAGGRAPGGNTVEGFHYAGARRSITSQGTLAVERRTVVEFGASIIVTPSTRSPGSRQRDSGP